MTIPLAHSIDQTGCPGVFRPLDHIIPGDSEDRDYGPGGAIAFARCGAPARRLPPGSVRTPGMPCKACARLSVPFPRITGELPSKPAHGVDAMNREIPDLPPL